MLIEFESIAYIRHFVLGIVFRFLAISSGCDSPVPYPEQVQENLLAFLVQGLPSLQQLDISGTSLAGCTYSGAQT